MLPHATDPQATYRAVGGDSDAPAIVFEPSGPGSDAEPIASRADDPRIGWTEPEGVQAVAQAILEHHTGSEPDQAELEALVMDRGDLWTANATWTLTVAELDGILERP